MNAEQKNTEINVSLKSIEKMLARKSHLAFMRYCWQNSSEKFHVGLHTKEICRLIDESIEALHNNQSTFLLIKVHFRAGKSDIVSRYLPPHFLGEFPDKDIMVVGYAQSLVDNFSKFSRLLVTSREYKELYPNIELSGGVQSWGAKGHIGIVTESGITSGITGKGYTLGICDDYVSSRSEAESETVRNSLWEHFTNDFLTRRAPTSITIVLATPWHVDDIIGRIEKKMNPGSDNYDENFPKFRVVSFPAVNGDVEIGVKDRKKYGDKKYHLEKIHYDYLFPERFDEAWYKSQFASLGSYAASGLLQCNPQIRGGNLFSIDKIQYHNSESEFPQTKYIRVWDLAHTAKQTQKEDPDWTSGTLLAYTKIEGMWHLWIKDVARMRGKSPERDNFIRAVSDKDGMGITIAVENSVDSKDAVSNMQTILNGKRIVKPLNIGIDKVARASYVEPIFEAGHVHILRGSWNLDWLNEVKDFPRGRHDDQMDNITAGYFMCCREQKGITVGRVLGI